MLVYWVMIVSEIGAALVGVQENKRRMLGKRIIDGTWNFPRFT